MARYLLNVLESYRVDTVPEALAIRDEFNAAGEYDLQSFSYTTKYNKKTEEEYQVVKVKKVVNAEKDPRSTVQVAYEY